MKPTILHVEDDLDNLMLVRRVLPASKYNLIEAKNGRQGLAIAESQHVDLILLDINLPDLDGYEVARRLRSSPNPALAHKPIIAITANAMKGDAGKALNAGCDVYMSKPINIQELAEKVDRFVMSLLGAK